ncbi:MAG: hypothetical protein KDC43_16865 [Saprospiraceae bacterium]|nr:hypothetical protein [Saprospiraceae bacterium]MCB0625534.1 hypothetical protein [Saprospiraceae bacterium]MCB0675152.1 hypothetical protein [Saprospiraceae bacterium]MCB0683543.1 hypothetical protein [Saprospiraceae bacterium]
MSKIRDLIELGFLLGGHSEPQYRAIMQKRRYHPVDQGSIDRELARVRKKLHDARQGPGEGAASLQL